MVVADRPYAIEPLFTRDPEQIDDVQVLMAMLVIRGIYEKHRVRRLNHGIGFDTAAIELLLPTYAESLGLRGEICMHWALNPHPTLIPAIESGWVQSVHCFGGEVGMEAYVAARSDIFFTGADGSLRSNRALCQAAGRSAGFALPPVMIYGDDVTHVVPEEGIAYLYLARDADERRAALAAVAGVTPVGMESTVERADALRAAGIVAYAEDIGVRRSQARRSLLAARTMRELVDWSDGLYAPPGRYRSW